MRSAYQKLPVRAVGSFKNNVKPMPDGAWASGGYEGSYRAGRLFLLLQGEHWDRTVQGDACGNAGMERITLEPLMAMQRSDQVHLLLGGQVELGFRHVVVFHLHGAQGRPLKAWASVSPMSVGSLA
jgi:hypothetical protein